MRDRYIKQHDKLIARTYLACYQNSHDMSDADKETYTKAQEKIEKAQEDINNASDVIAKVYFKNQVKLTNFISHKEKLAKEV